MVHHERLNDKAKINKSSLPFKHLTNQSEILDEKNDK